MVTLADVKEQKDKKIHHDSVATGQIVDHHIVSIMREAADERTRAQQKTWADTQKD